MTMACPTVQSSVITAYRLILGWIHTVHYTYAHTVVTMAGYNIQFAVALDVIVCCCH